jgi:hypothetical protein
MTRAGRPLALANCEGSSVDVFVVKIVRGALKPDLLAHGACADNQDAVKVFAVHVLLLCRTYPARPIIPSLK